MLWSKLVPIVSSAMKFHKIEDIELVQHMILYHFPIKKKIIVQLEIKKINLI